MSEAIANRRKYLFTCIQEAITEHGVWSSEGGEIAVLPDGRFDRALTALFEAFETGDMPEELRPIDRILGDFQRDYREYHDRMALSQNWNLSPPASMAGLMSKLSDLFVQIQMPPAPDIESIAELDKLKVSDAQIARMYGWTKIDGSPDVHRVQVQRREAPDKRRPNPLNEQREAARQREAKRMEEAVARQQKREEAANAVAPESIEELIEQGVSGQQICDMKKLTPQKLERYCHDNKLDMPGWKQSIEQVAADAADAERAEREEASQPTPIHGMPEDVAPVVDPEDDLAEEVDYEELSIEEQILLAAEENPDATASELADMFETSHQKVSSVLRRREEVAS